MENKNNKIEKELKKLKKIEVENKEFKNVRVTRNNLQYGVPYNPYIKMTGKRQVIKVERTG